MTKVFMDRLAAAPISWGICEVPGWGRQLPVDQVLAEMHELGFTQTELGAAGYLPSDPQALTELLAGHELALCGAFIPVVIHDPAETAATRRAATEAADLLRAAGASYFITAPVLTWDWGPRRPLNDAEWAHSYAMLDELEQFCADRGLVQAVHPHIGTLIESADDVARVLDNTAAGFTLDTGHLLAGGYDPVRFATDHFDRVRHVHLKDIVLELAGPVMAGERSIMQGVQDGLFCNLGDGDAPIAEVVAITEAAGFDGWYVIEQDAALSDTGTDPVAIPKDDIATSVAYLAGLVTDEPVEPRQPMEGNTQ